MGVQLKAGEEVFDYKLNLTGFCSIIKNRIVWEPGASGMYTPQNFDCVWSRGAEVSLGANIKRSDLQMGCDFNYTFTLSNKQNEDGSYSKVQMIYLPIHKLSAFAYASYHKVRLAYTHKIEGLRYYSDEKTDHVNGYGLGNLNLSSSILLYGVRMGYGVSINNIWNTSYQVMPWYPMPLRNYMVHLSFEFGS